MEAILFEENLRVAIKNNNKRKFYSSLKNWFNLVDSNPPKNSILLNADALVSDLILYSIKEKYEIFFLEIKPNLAHRINRSNLVRIYEYATWSILYFLRDEIRVDVTGDFEKKYLDVAGTIGASKVNDILYLAEEVKFNKVLTWESINEFEKIFLNDFLKIFNLFNIIKKRKGQPQKYTDEDFAELNRLLENGVKGKIAAKKVLSERNYLSSSVPSFLKLNRERLPEKTLKKIQRKENGN
jgi:hypothetical protein